MKSKPQKITDQVFLVTGATDGIGLAVAEALAKMGVRLFIVGRRMEKTMDVAARLKKVSGNDQIEYLLAEFSSQESIRNLVRVFKKKADRLDCLIHVAGAVETEYTLTVDGIEKNFAVNYLSQFLLNHLLLDYLKISGKSRIIHVAGAYHTRGKINLDDLNLKQDFSWQEALYQAKLASVLFTYSLARKLKNTGIRVNCLHPGAVRTGMILRTKGFTFLSRLLYRMLSPFFRSPAKGAETILWLATSPEAKNLTGKYFIDKKAVKSSPTSYDTELQEQLWKASLQLTHLEAFDNVSALFAQSN